MTISLPRTLPLGTLRIGPSFFGCCNTGLEPTILRSRALEVLISRSRTFGSMSTISRGFRFVVGPHVYVEQAIQKLLSGKLPMGQNYIDFEKRGDRRVRFFKTYAAAKKHFVSLVEAVQAENKKQKEIVTALQVRARRGEMAAILELSDHM